MIPSNTTGTTAKECGQDLTSLPIGMVEQFVVGSLVLSFQHNIMHIRKEGSLANEFT